MAEPEFGLPRRNAQQDANAGIINPPTVKVQARNQNIRRDETKSSLDAGVAAISSSLGDVLRESLADEAAHSREQKTQAAIARQGRQKGINAIDIEKKRSDFARGLFGENVSYRAAQQQAAATSVQDNYNIELNRLDEFAGSSPEEYDKVLSDGLNNALDKYKGDKETQALVAAAWQAQAGKLAQQHEKTHFAWTLTQLDIESKRQVMTTFDTINLEYI